REAPESAERGRPVPAGEHLRRRRQLVARAAVRRGGGADGGGESALREAGAVSLPPAAGRRAAPSREARGGDRRVPARAGGEVRPGPRRGAVRPRQDALPEGRDGEVVRRAPPGGRGQRVESRGLLPAGAGGHGARPRRGREEGQARVLAGRGDAAAVCRPPSAAVAPGVSFLPFDAVLRMKAVFLDRDGTIVVERG